MIAECHQCESTVGVRKVELVEPRGQGLEPYRVHALLCPVCTLEHETHFAKLRARRGTSA